MNGACGREAGPDTKGQSILWKGGARHKMVEHTVERRGQTQRGGAYCDKQGQAKRGGEAGQSMLWRGKDQAQRGGDEEAWAIKGAEQVAEWWAGHWCLGVGER